MIRPRRQKAGRRHRIEACRDAVATIRRMPVNRCPTRPHISRAHVLVALLGALVFAGACSNTATKPAESSSVKSGSSSLSSSAAPSSSRKDQPAGRPQEPLALREYVTDTAGAFDSSARTEIEGAINRLYADRQIRLWVVFVDKFATVEVGLPSGNAIAWARETLKKSDVGRTDGIFAVAIKGRAYAVQMTKDAVSVNQQEIEGILADVKSYLQRSDWKGATLLVANRIDAAADSP
jgi:hypothetical protein